MSAAARAWTAALLLAAVFLGHGLQCGSSSTAEGHAHAAMTEVVLVASALQPAGIPAHHDAVDDGATDHRHGLPGHLLAVCLAVVAVGLAVLLGTAGASSRSVRRGPPPSARSSTTAWRVPARPPDILTLCVLRI
ncbi:DUF6153 family protein [Blastococcus sp. LR1]|uniref:DUF6153 family protein n=1 Tax=Blastococcus sp. LR1 TaxID=2877000 RepID=UPI001CCA169C|nr:DUF6153 family protein [Blastococcus sp. LR1]MCA0144058.1 DUF6153 family protein [Blastococcus sp. LR1]